MRATCWWSAQASAGLQCARELQAAGREVLVWEASDDVGGRIRTDRIDGFLVDRGFQVLNPAYPAVRRWVDVEALALQAFGAGLRVRRAGLPRGPRPPRARARPDPADPAQRTAGPPLCRGAAAVGRPGVCRATAASRQRRSAAGGPGPGRLLRRTPQGCGPVPRRSPAGRRGQQSNEFALQLVRVFATGVPGLPRDGMQALPRQLADTPHHPGPHLDPGGVDHSGRGRGPGHRPRIPGSGPAMWSSPPIRSAPPGWPAAACRP